ncbi:MAG: STAS domain-containing protein [Rickettsiales bacterium]|nr:STAS domain-containing protein [Rickettsiales bacterium]
MDQILNDSASEPSGRSERCGLELTLQEHDDFAEVILEGEFTYADNGAFKRLIEQLGASDHTDIYVDFSGPHYMDSAALGMLLLLRDAMAEKSPSIVLRGAHGQVLKMFQLSHFDSLFEVQFDA